MGTPCRGPHAWRRASARSAARARALEIAHDDGVQRPVVLLDAREIQVQQLEAADLPLLDIGGELPGGAEGDLEHGRPPARSRDH
jgi:hypothetical protein